MGVTAVLRWFVHQRQDRADSGHPRSRDRTGKVYPKLPFAARETSPSVTLARLSYLAIAGRNYRYLVASPFVKLSPRQW
jgi:hypothetical protein